MNTLSVAGAFGGKRLLVLGGTGFLGKIFWSMLLHRFPGVGRLHMLVRSKGTQSSEVRFWQQIVPSPVLDPLRAKFGDQFENVLREKIAILDGDLGLQNCGLNEQTLQGLRGQIDCVVNVAGVVDFSPPLDSALDANAFGTQNVVSVARALGDLPLYHTSTCYTAGRRKGPIHEEDPRKVPFPRVNELDSALWNADREVTDCLDLIAQANSRCDDAFRQSDFRERAKHNLLERHEPTEGPAFDAELKRVRRKFVADRLIEAGTERATHWGWPNIYTYTKSIGEQVVANSGLRFAIGRPACCESTLAFPSVGWNEGVSTSAPIMYLVLEGALQIPGRQILLDFIPTDMVAAGMILSVAELLTGTEKPVYQYGTSDANPCTSARLGELMGLYKRKYYLRHRKNPLASFVAAHMEPIVVGRRDFERFGPSLLASVANTGADFAAKLPKLERETEALRGFAKQQDRIARIMNIFAPFTHDQNGPFCCNNTDSAYGRLSPEERALLPWAPRAIDWQDYMMNVHSPSFEKLIYSDMQRRGDRGPKPIAPHATLVSLLLQMADRHRECVALSEREEDGLSRHSYGHLADRAKQIASDAPIHRGDRVAIDIADGAAWVQAFFGVLFAGGVAVCIARKLPSIERNELLKKLGATLLICEGATDCEVPTWVLPAAGHSNETADKQAADIAPGDPAVVVNEPELRTFSHGELTSLLASLGAAFPMEPTDRVPSLLPLHLAFALICGLLLPLSRGSQIIFAGVGDDLGELRSTVLIGVPETWKQLERRLWKTTNMRHPLRKIAGNLTKKIGKPVEETVGRALFPRAHAELGADLRLLISGGAMLPEPTKRTFARIGLTVGEVYMQGALPVGFTDRGKGIRALPGIELKVDQGEILRKEATNWVASGDVGRLDSRGRITVVGKKANFVASEQGDLQLEDIENSLRIQRVSEFCVASVGDILSAVLVLQRASDTHDDRRRLRDKVLVSARQKIADLPKEQQPTTLWLVDQPLPRTAHGELDRDRVAIALQALHQAVKTMPKTPSELVSLLFLRAGSDLGDHLRNPWDRAILRAGFESIFRPLSDAEYGNCHTLNELDVLAKFTPETAPMKESVWEQMARGIVGEVAKNVFDRVQQVTFDRYMDVKIEGAANIPHNRRTIVVANHASHLDLALVRHALGDYGKALIPLAAADYFFDDEVRRTLLKMFTRAEAVDRRRLGEAMRSAGELLLQGHSLLIFPEGSRSPDGSIREFRSLVGNLALAYNVDILPVYLGGTYHALKKGEYIPRRKALTVRVGPPISIERAKGSIEGKSEADMARAVSKIARDAVVALSEGTLFDLTSLKNKAPNDPFEELIFDVKGRWIAQAAKKPLTYYVTLGAEDRMKWTISVSPDRCEVSPGKPASGNADCVIKTSLEVFSKIVREGYMPGPSEFLSGAIKTSDVSLLVMFPSLFRLG